MVPTIIFAVIAAIVAVLGFLNYLDNRKRNYDKVTFVNTTIAIGLPSMICACLIATLIPNDFALVIVFVAISLFLISFLLTPVFNFLRCKTEVQAVYVDYQGESGQGTAKKTIALGLGNHVQYHPIFEYEYNGVTYRARSRKGMPWDELESSYQKGNEYTIYIWHKAPTLCMCKRVFGITEIISLVALGLYIYTLATGLFS